jgi:hypothetical protein
VVRCELGGTGCELRVSGYVLKEEVGLRVSGENRFQVSLLRPLGYGGQAGVRNK